MEIQVQETPNPNARKFVLPTVHFSQPRSFADTTTADLDPLARALFALGGIYNVFMVQDFVTVNKYPDAGWTELESAIRSTIVTYLNDQRDAV